MWATRQRLIKSSASRLLPSNHIVLIFFWLGSVGTIGWSGLVWGRSWGRRAQNPSYALVINNDGLHGGRQYCKTMTLRRGAYSTMVRAMAGKARESGREGPGSVSGRGSGVTVAAVDGQMNLGLRSVRRRWRE